MIWLTLLLNETNEKFIQLLEEQLAHSNQQNTKKLYLKQIEALTEQVRQLTKALYGSKSEKSNIKHQTDKVLYLKMIRLLTILSTQKNKANRRLSYTVVRKIQ